VTKSRHNRRSISEYMARQVVANSRLTLVSLHPHVRYVWYAILRERSEARVGKCRVCMWQAEAGGGVGIGGGGGGGGGVESGRSPIEPPRIESHLLLDRRVLDRAFSVLSDEGLGRR
jgi:hypothetical protein